MRYLAVTLRRAFWLACVVVCLTSTVAAAAETTFLTDLDGDGLRDRVTFNSSQPFIVRVWLSSSGSTQVIHSRIPVVKITAADLDGDHRLELVARDGSDGVQIWKKGRRGFKSYSPKRLVFGAIGHRGHRKFDDGPTSSPPVVPGHSASSPLLDLCAHPHSVVVLVGRAPDIVVHLRSLATPRLVSAPRPPPGLAA